MYWFRWLYTIFGPPAIIAVTSTAAAAVTPDGLNGEGWK